MMKIAVTELEYNKAACIFEQTTDMQCLCAPTAEADLAEFIRMHSVEAAIVGVDKYCNRLYEALPKGGIIARFGVGHDGIDKNQAGTKGLYCINTPGVLDTSVAECAVGLMLSAARNLVRSASDNRGGIWKNSLGTELRGKTLAVIGCGNIGRKVATIAKLGFDMCVSGYDVAKPADLSHIDNFYSSFAEAVKNADYVSLHIPDIPATHNFINAESLKQMKTGAVLINTARGGIIDENALYDALESDKIAAAALDVFKEEPYVPQSEKKNLRSLDRLIMTPHIGSSTRDACERMAESSLQGIRDIRSGRITQVSLLK